MRRLAPALVLALGIATTADAQVNEYEGRYGPTIEVSVDSLLDMPEQYAGRAGRTRGQFEMIPSGRGQQYGLRGTFGGYLYIYPRQEVIAAFEQEARRWSGKE